jgi:hypothetical protein
MIATRTKAALAAAKVRGVALGGPKLAVAKHTCRGDEQGPSRCLCGQRAAGDPGDTASRRQVVYAKSPML